jgi:hypothetical protein
VIVVKNKYPEQIYFRKAAGLLDPSVTALVAEESEILGKGECI